MLVQFLDNLIWDDEIDGENILDYGLNLWGEYSFSFSPDFTEYWIADTENNLIIKMKSNGYDFGLPSIAAHYDSLPSVF